MCQNNAARQRFFFLKTCEGLIRKFLMIGKNLGPLQMSIFEHKLGSFSFIVLARVWCLVSSDWPSPDLLTGSALIGCHDWVLSGNSKERSLSVHGPPRSKTRHRLTDFLVFNMSKNEFILGKYKIFSSESQSFVLTPGFHAKITLVGCNLHSNRCKFYILKQGQN